MSDESASGQGASQYPVLPTILEGDTYQEGDAIVLTAQFLLRRGYCCGNGCRHCPYGEKPPPVLIKPP